MVVSRGSGEIERALWSVVQEMIKQYGIQTKLTAEQLSRQLSGYFIRD